MKIRLSLLRSRLVISGAEWHRGHLPETTAQRQGSDWSGQSLKRILTRSAVDARVMTTKAPIDSANFISPLDADIDTSNVAPQTTTRLMTLVATSQFDRY